MKNPKNIRAIAAHTLQQVLKGRSLSDCLPTISHARDQGFLQALCYGVCRFYFRLDAMLNLLLEKPLKSKDQDIHCLLLIGLYQLSEMRVPSYAAVAETVAAAIDLKKPWAKGLINAVLRHYERQAHDINQKVMQNIPAWYSHPEWMVNALKEAWPLDWQAILSANNEHPPFTLRVNLQHVSLETYLSQLPPSFLAYRIPETSAGIILEPAVDVQQLPGFNEGDISVQDGAAQLAAESFHLQPGLRVLDACAAPGGKTAHLFEREPSIELTAIDCNPERLKAVSDNAARLKIKATILCHDAGDIASWWDGKLFDRILLDVPCSGTGVIRRHPDIKLLRRLEDIAKLGQEQMRLLSQLWTVLKPGGLLLYVTCSIFPDENERIVEQFLNTRKDAKEEKIQAAWGLTRTIGRQILPGMHRLDGFYFARLRKIEG